MLLNSGHVTVTVSIGVTEVGGRVVFDNDLHAADQYLYLAKQADETVPIATICICVDVFFYKRFSL